MSKIGVFPGKFLPPHRGHLTAIMRAHAMCDKLYVVICDRKEYDALTVDGKTVTAKMRKVWFMKELQNLDGIEVVIADENTIPTDPDGWPYWFPLLERTVPEKFNIVFGSEESYRPYHEKYGPQYEYKIIDPQRDQWPISGTDIRNNVYKHWDYLLGASRPFFAKKILITGSESCVDSETEYFNGVQWKKISEYQIGEQVLQYNPDGTANLVFPERYINLPLKNTDKFYQVQNTYGTWKQVYTQDHDLVYLSSKKNLNKITMKEVLEKHTKNPAGFYGKFLTNFKFSGTLSLDPNFLRLAIAISADGSLMHSGTRWRVRVKKERKIVRMRELLNACKIPIDERIYNDGYSNFYIPWDFGVKQFPPEWYNLTTASMKVFIEEIFLWDGYSPQDGRGSSYFSTIRENALLVQFIITAMGNKTIWNEDIREGKTTIYRVQKSNVKHLSISLNKLNGNKKDQMISEYSGHNGKKYCFTVPSGMLVLRRNNHIFITGNCGKTTLTKKLAKIFYTSWSEEVGRYYSERYLGRDETGFEVKDFERIAYLQHENDLDALNKANKVCFFDTDAIVTQFFLGVYLNQHSSIIDSFIDPNKYDLVLMLTPEVKWVDDGLRFLKENDQRWSAFNILKNLYTLHGFKDKIIEVSGASYEDRLTHCIEAVNKEILHG